MDEALSGAAWAEITNLVHRYAYNIRKGRGRECAELFTEDAEFEIWEINPLEPDSSHLLRKLVGRDAITEYLVQTVELGGIVCPLIHNLLIDVSGNTAQSTALMTARTWPAGQELMGEYRDAFRHESRWLFQSRQYTLFRQEPNP